MSLRSSLGLLTCCLLPVSLISTVYLYFYPLWLGCAFPSTIGSLSDGFKDTFQHHTSFNKADYTNLAPFRLLVLADPQLEGDSSFPEPEDAFTAKLRSHWNDLQKTELLRLPTVILNISRQITVEDIPEALWTVRKTIDLFGNDYYLAHIYRTLHWWTKPTHVTVLGDLIGSQWVSDDEFVWRGWRYWNRVFAGACPVDHSYMSMYTKEPDERCNLILDPHSSDWNRQVINIAGNHDIGYAGDISHLRTSRFERVFGKLNWDIRFSYPPQLIPENYANGPVPSIQLVVLNSMLLDTPALNSTLQTETYEYINNLIQHRLSPVEPPDRNASFTLLLTHVPLHKPAGVCVDAPLFDFWDIADEGGGQFEEGGLKEQNHLSQHVSETGILQSLFGMTGNADAAMGGIGRRGLILNGHDHEGCDVVHYVERYNAMPEIAVAVDLNVANIPEAIVDGPWKEEDFMLIEDMSENRSSVSMEKLLDNEKSPSGSQSNKSSVDATAQSAGSPTESLSSSISSASPGNPTPTWRWKSLHSSQYPPSEPSHSDPEDSNADLNIALREVTLRSMMGSYGGNAGLLSIWFDFSRGVWEYEITMCKAGVQHIWWTIHILDVVTVCVLLLWVAELIYQPGRKTVIKRVRAISYVRERPKRPGGTNADSGSKKIVKVAKAVEDIKRTEGIGVNRRFEEGETEKRRVYQHVLK